MGTKIILVTANPTLTKSEANTIVGLLEGAVNSVKDSVMNQDYASYKKGKLIRMSENSLAKMPKNSSLRVFAYYSKLLAKMRILAESSPDEVKNIEEELKTEKEEKKDGK